MPAKSGANVGGQTYKKTYARNTEGEPSVLQRHSTQIAEEKDGL